MAFLFMNPMYHCCPRTMDPIHKPRPLLENRPEPSFTAPKPAPFTPLKQDPFQEHLNKNVFQQSNPSYTQLRQYVQRQDPRPQPTTPRFQPSKIRHQEAVVKKRPGAHSSGPTLIIWLQLSLITHPTTITLTQQYRIVSLRINTSRGYR